MQLIFLERATLAVRVKPLVESEKYDYCVRQHDRVHLASPYSGVMSVNADGLVEMGSAYGEAFSIVSASNN